MKCHCPECRKSFDSDKHSCRRTTICKPRSNKKGVEHQDWCQPCTDKINRELGRQVRETHSTQQGVLKAKIEARVRAAWPKK